jgi:AmiR/NasT family two-component response regulator
VTVGAPDQAPQQATLGDEVEGFFMTVVEQIQVLLVDDDHSILRQGLRSLLESYPNIEVVGEASNGEEAVVNAGKLQPSVVVMDISM